MVPRRQRQSPGYELPVRIRVTPGVTVCKLIPEYRIVSLLHQSATAKEPAQLTNNRY